MIQKVVVFISLLMLFSCLKKEGSNDFYGGRYTLEIKDCMYQIDRELLNKGYKIERSGDQIIMRNIFKCLPDDYHIQTDSYATISPDSIFLIINNKEIYHGDNEPTTDPSCVCYHINTFIFDEELAPNKPIGFKSHTD